MTLTERFANSWTPEPFSRCWLWTAALNSLGYGYIRAWGSIHRAHRVSWILNGGDIPDNQCVLHRCDVKSCINPDHLFLGTRSDNTRDMQSKGRTAFGEKHGLAKLTSRDAISILGDERSLRRIAESYGVDHSTIWKIKRGLIWTRQRLNETRELALQNKK